MISFKCPGCQAPFNVPDDKAGKSGKCPKCLTPFRVPGGSLAPPPSASPPPPPRPTPPRPPAPPVAEEPAAELDADEERPRKKPARREDAEELRDEEPAADKRPRKRDEDEEPRKKPVGREDDGVDEDEERPRKKARRDEGEEPPPRRPARKPRVLVSNVDRALKVLRSGQFLDLLAFLSLVLVLLGYVVIILTSNKGYVVRFEGDAKENGILLAPLALPSLLLFASGIWTAVGRLMLVVSAKSGGGGGVFLGTAFFALGRMLLGGAAAGLVVWLCMDPALAFPKPRYYNDPAPQGGYLIYVLGAFVAAVYCGGVGEALSMAGLALVGWRHPTTDQQRGRIAAAATFYPLVLLLLFFLGLAVTGLRETKMLDEYVGVFLLVVLTSLQVIQYILVSRAYRFPLTTTDQTESAPSAPSW